MPPDDRLPKALYEAFWHTLYPARTPFAAQDPDVRHGWRTVAAVARVALSSPSFAHALGARVRWAGDLGHTLVVLQRRYTERPDALPPLIDYLVARDGDAAQGRQWRAHWACAADVTPAEEGT